MTITYQCKCGCICTPNQLVAIQTDAISRRLSRRVRRCNKHRETNLGNIVQKFNTCAICGETFPVNLNGRAKIKCPAHEKTKIKTKKITIDCAEILKSKDIKAIPGETLNFYECGCIIPDSYDAGILKYFKKNQTRNRACPFHNDPKALIGKYKVCGQCGAGQTGWAVRSSKYCQHCRHDKEASKKMALIPQPRLNNIEQTDPDRWDCSRRPICLENYIKYATIPCKKCGGYDPIPLNMDHSVYEITNDDYMYTV